MKETTRATLQKFFANPRVWFGLVILSTFLVTAILAPVITPYSSDDMDLLQRLAPPDRAHWLGCDLNGGDVLSAVIFGSRTTLIIAFTTVLFSLFIGTCLGIVSGYRLGWLDALLMRLVDIVMSIPGILIAMILAAFLGASVFNIILAITATGWTSSARLVRGQVLSLRERDYVLASQALGATDMRIMTKHIFPELLTPLLVHGTFSLSSVIIIESSLSFLGLGLQDQFPTWGGLLGQGRSVLIEAPHLSVAPGLVIFLVVLALNFVGDALRDTLDRKKA